MIDTNVLVSSLSSRSRYHWFTQALLAEKFELFITDEILFEYEEILHEKYSYTSASNFLTAIRELPNVHFVQIYFYWNILNDPDDNKFLDCYVASSADYLITNDRGFNKLKGIDFPKANVISIEEFETIFQTAL